MEQQQKHRFLTTPNGNDFGGDSLVSSNTKINWAPVNLPPNVQSHGASVEGVLEACAARLSQIQKTPQAADVNAKALWHVLQAMDLLSGKPAVGAAGFGSVGS